jgi:putative addiction module killer protein
MISVKPLPEFEQWLSGIPDEVRGIVTARLRRLSFGLFGDCAPVGQGVQELRIHVGKGWRVYFVQRGPVLIVLLAGGSKRTQNADIKTARLLASALRASQAKDKESP